MLHRDSNANSKASEQVIAAIKDHIVRVAGGYTLHWVMVHDIAQQLALDGAVVNVAVRTAIGRGWLVGDSDPPDSVRLSASLVGQHERTIGTTGTPARTPLALSA
ncbi:MAG: hypothetical protein AB7F22_16040 [Reyranella sp.]|uniref:hypothetical protein n=1 Tax=Reyranella sp. TaxID=1929291 RepID=UPI003D115880